MIVLVARGEVPWHVRPALAQARLTNPHEPLVLLHDGALPGWQSFARRENVRLYDVERLRRDARLDAFYRRPDPRLGFRSRFWQHASGRFFALRAFMEQEGIESVTHIENDVLVYACLDRLRKADALSRAALSTVFESPNRAIPGVVHVGARASLDALADFVLAEPMDLVTEDMTRFAAFRRARPELVAELPTRPPPPSCPPGWTESLFEPGHAVPLPDGRWLFDGARFGQYLGGIDPRNAGVRVQRWLRWQTGDFAQPNGFINESCTDDPSQYRYTVGRSSGAACPEVIAGGRRFLLATLHVHSKKLDRFTSPALAALASRTDVQASA